MLLQLYNALRASGPAAHDVVLAGDSAGGNLALALQLSLRDSGVEQARALALVSPWLDLTASRPSVRRNEEFDYGNSSFLLPQARAFAGSAPLDDPRLSLINARLDGLALLLVLVGGAELLLDEGVELVQRATQAGVTAELHIAHEMPHNSPILADYHRTAKAACAHFASYISTQLRGA